MFKGTRDDTEWQLNTAVFENIIKTFGTLDLDPFASRVNKQLPKFDSWHPEPEAWVIDTFLLVRKQMYFYMFRPFNLVEKVLSKVLREKTRTAIIKPN